MASASLPALPVFGIPPHRPRSALSVLASRQARRCASARKRATSIRPAGKNLLASRSRQQPFALGFLARELAGAADRFPLLSRRLFGWLLEKSPALHFAKDAFALHLFLEHSKRLVDVVVANKNLQETFPSCVCRTHQADNMPPPAIGVPASIRRHYPGPED